MNLFNITLYSVSKKDFFDLLYNINCDARYYVAFTNVDRFFDIEGVEREELVEIGSGVRISRPIAVGRRLAGGYNTLSSLSHNGVLAVYYNESGLKYQLTDLVNERQIEIGVESWTHTGFYDNSMVVLIYGKQLGVCSVEDMFSKKSMNALKMFGDVEVDPFADVSLLHSTRVLVFFSKSYIPHEFDVDTGVIRELGIRKNIWAFASLTGIDAGVKGMFVERGNNYFTCSLNKDNSTSPVLKCNDGTLCTFIPSSSDPRDIKKGMKIFFDKSFFTNTIGEVYLINPLRYQEYQSIVRLYQDIFLVYDGYMKKWCLVKILVP